jgi:integrase/recombinase XerD
MQKMDQMMDIEILSAGAHGSCTADATTSQSRDAMGRTANGETQKALSPGDFDGFAALVGRYLEHRAIQNFSPATITTERWVLRQLSVWCCRRDVRRPVDVTRAVMEAWQRAVYEHRTAKGGSLSASSQRHRLSMVRGFFEWLTRRDIIKGSPAAFMELPRRERSLPSHVFTPAEVELILAQPDVGTPFGLRDRAILETLYSTGMRRAELAAVNVIDVGFDEGMVAIRKGKGRKGRVVPIGDRALSWIEKYLLEARPLLLLDAIDAVFITERGRRFSLGHLSRVVSTHVGRAGIGKLGSCHAFRHSMATALVNNDADVRHVQEMLGHESLSSTQLYTHIAIRRLKEVHDRTHPGARLPRIVVADVRGIERPKCRTRRPHGYGQRPGKCAAKTTPSIAPNVAPGASDKTLIESDPHGGADRDPDEVCSRRCT